MLRLETQKQHLAQVEAKIEKVRHAYRTFAAERERWRVDVSDQHKVYLLHPRADERGLGSELLSEADLSALIVEHNTAVEALNQTKAKLASFGINA